MQQAHPGPLIAIPVARRPSRRVLVNSDRLISIGLISPSVVAIGVFVYLFIAQTAYVSVVRWNDLAPDYTFVGLTNYARLFGHERFQADLRNTLVFTTAFIVVCVAVGLLLATLLDSRIKGEAFFRSIFMLPLAISFVVTGVAWRWLESPSAGFNLLFDAIGLGFLRNGWFTDTRIGILGVVLAASWQMSGYVMALYLAGLRSIPEELREAARVDGASELQVFRLIILPLLNPITLTAVIILGHIALKIFDLTVSMTGSGPGFATDVPAMFMYETTFFGNRFSQGASIAVVLLLLVGAVIVPYLAHTARGEARR
jgi:glucose/mannose transport system permease protein